MKSDLNFPLENNPSVFPTNIIDFFIEFIFATIKTYRGLSDSDTLTRDYVAKLAQTNIIPGINLAQFLTGKTYMTDPAFLTVYHLFQTFKQCYQSLVYRKDYGFPLIKMENSHQNIFYAVPYAAVSDPIIGSTYSDIDISIVLTTLTYYYHPVRTDDIIRIIDDISVKVTHLDKILSGETLDKLFHKELALLDIDSITSVRRLKEQSIHHKRQYVTEAHSQPR